jgi:hypothetical protein
MDRLAATARGIVPPDSRAIAPLIEPPVACALAISTRPKITAAEDTTTMIAALAKRLVRSLLPTPKDPR